MPAMPAPQITTSAVCALMWLAVAGVIIASAPSVAGGAAIDHARARRYFRAKGTRAKMTLAVGAMAFVALYVLAPVAALGEVELPPGMSANVYVTGEGFDTSAERKAPGFPSTSTLAFDETGALYLGRVGRRYLTGEIEDLSRVYRIPAGGARLSPSVESRFFYGPPLANPQIGTTRDRRELFLTTFDRERKIGVVYRVVDGRAELFAGGTPERGSPPLLKQPEGVAVDGSGNVYVADRDRGAIVRLDATGRVLDPRYVAVKRPPALAAEASGAVLIGSDEQ